MRAAVAYTPSRGNARRPFDRADVWGTAVPRACVKNVPSIEALQLPWRSNIPGMSPLGASVPICRVSTAHSTSQWSTPAGLQSLGSRKSQRSALLESSSSLASVSVADLLRSTRFSAGSRSQAANITGVLSMSASCPSLPPVSAASTRSACPAQRELRPRTIACGVRDPPGTSASLRAEHAAPLEAGAGLVVNRVGSPVARRGRHTTSVAFANGRAGCWMR